MIEKKYRGDKRAMKRDLEELKKKTLRNKGRLPGNEKKLEADSTAIVEAAKKHALERKATADRQIEEWAKDEAKFVASKLKGAVTTIGGFGFGRKNICDVCGLSANYIKKEFINDRLVGRCQTCISKMSIPRETYLKIIIH